VNGYPDRQAATIRSQLAERHGVEAEQIVVGNGAAELLQAAAFALLTPGEELVTPWPSYPLYPLMAQRAGGRPVPVDLEGGRVDVDALLGAVGDRTRVVVLCNPNDPTGTYLASDAVGALASSLPESAHLLVDEAYIEFQDVEPRDSVLRLVDAFPRLLCALAAGEDPSGIPGVARRVGNQVVATPPAPPRHRLDDLPVPDYEEYFERSQRLGLLPPVGHRTTWIPFESARGCWWGEKHHCTFCGLNGSTMKYRSKSPQRVFAELAEQARRYRSFRFEAVDNILDVTYLNELFPTLTANNTDYEIFYEVKANLTRAQLRTMARAGLVGIGGERRECLVALGRKRRECLVALRRERRVRQVLRGWVVRLLPQ